MDQSAGAGGGKMRCEEGRGAGCTAMSLGGLGSWVIACMAASHLGWLEGSNWADKVGQGQRVG